MRAQRAGSNRLVEARLRAYDAAVKSGLSSAEAMKVAQAITRRSLRKQKGR